MATPVQDTIQRVREIDVDKYKYGFTTDIESVRAPKGLSEDVVRFISAKKGEPAWLLEWRLEAYRRWRTMVLARHPLCTCGAIATEADHIIPLSQGGGWSLENGSGLCKACHSRKTLRETRGA